jgi:hypothetical protein
VPVEGNAELTPARLLGHFDPAQVLAQGYTADVFADGPLLEAMRSSSCATPVAGGAPVGTAAQVPSVLAMLLGAAGS